MVLGEGEDGGAAPRLSRARRKHPDLLFEWLGERGRRRSLVMFLNLSLALHVACFYAFQVVYPPTVASRPETTRVTYLDSRDPAVRDVIERIENRAVFFDGSLRQPLPGVEPEDWEVVLTPGFASHEPELRSAPEVFEPSGLPPLFAERDTFLPAPSRFLPGGRRPARPAPFEGPYVYRPRITLGGGLEGRRFAEVPAWGNEQEMLAGAAGNHARFLVEVDAGGRLASCLPWLGVEPAFDAALAEKLEFELRLTPSDGPSTGWLDLRW